MIQYCFNEELICITHYPQITPCSMGSFNSWNNTRMNWSSSQNLHNLINCNSFSMHFFHHCVHESVPRHGGKKLIEEVSKTQFINNPVITIAIDDRLIEVENHHYSLH
uniref:Uncharacterized protein n=1 Tax=Opuntia streptacantha TaxID=393608 RepID=A0A7C8ZPR7_OPUST